jgi:predicted dehydrogenase
MARIGIGLIGVGKHGSRYARHIVSDLPNVRLAGIARRDLGRARQQAAELGCRAYGDYRELIAAPDVDAVVVVVPPTLHPEIVEAAAARRRAFLLEKPAAAGLADAQRVLRAVQSAAIPVMVAQTLRYNEVVRLLLSERHRIGRIHGLRISQRFEPSRPSWIDDPAIAGGGITLHTGVHSFDLVRLLSGREADRVSCEMASVRTAETEDNFAAVIRLDGGAALATVAGSRATASRSGPIELAGEHGLLVADHVCGTAAIVEGSQRTPLTVPSALPTVREVLRDFTQALQHGRPMPIPLAEGLRAVALADACYRSAAAGRAVPVARIG